MTTFADVSEGVRATLAAYTHALDDGRTDDVVETFCPDGAIDMGALGTYEGRDALRAAYAGWAPRRPQRHLVLNTHITDWDEHEAKAVSDVVFLRQGKEGWGDPGGRPLPRHPCTTPTTVGASTTAPRCSKGPRNPPRGAR